MCLNITDNKGRPRTTLNKPKPRIATETMTVYKGLGPRLVSSVQGFRYKLNVKYKTEMAVYRWDDDGMWSVYDGFHSWNRPHYGYSRSVKCSIPKGAKYYIEATGGGDITYVSDQIVIVRRLTSREVDILNKR